jgi:hypothetical protein
MLSPMLFDLMPHQWPGWSQEPKRQLGSLFYRLYRSLPSYGLFGSENLRPDYFLFADIHVSHLSRGGTGVPGARGRACKSSYPRCSVCKICLSASVSALGGIVHPFTAATTTPSASVDLMMLFMVFLLFEIQFRSSEAVMSK